MKLSKKFLVVGLSLSLLLGVFVTGVYAANTWMSYTGNTELVESDVDEIMNILRQVNEDKITAEEALEELEAMNPPGLVKKIKELEEEIEKLKKVNSSLKTDNAALSDYIDYLESELTRANEEVEQVTNSTSDALKEARELIEE